MKTKLFLWKTVIKFLALVGIVSSFTSCNPNDNNNVAMYGAPAEEYNEINFSGSVLSEDSLKAIPAVRVTLIDQYNHDSIYTTSNSSGNFTLYKDAFADKNFTIGFKITDPVQSHGNFIGKKIDFVTNFRDINNKEKVINVQLKKQ
jgi:hypothetical protein